jgi:hypothetical protein
MKLNPPTFIILFGFLFALPLAIPILAQTLESTNYRIQMGNLNVTSGKKSSTTYNLTDTVGQLAPGPYTGTDYILHSGFQYIYETIREFSFSIDDLNIELGTLTPSVGATDSNIITVSSPYGIGYQVMVSENHPLQNQSGQTIPDTGCNTGACTESVSGVWTSATAYGFGFNAIGINSSGVSTGIGTSDYFADNTYYRQFANLAASPAESPQTIMSESNSAENRRAQITYKALISGVQPAGNYQNAITFTAVPRY